MHSIISPADFNEWGPNLCNFFHRLAPPGKERPHLSKSFIAVFIFSAVFQSPTAGSPQYKEISLIRGRSASGVVIIGPQQAAVDLRGA